MRCFVRNYRSRANKEKQDEGFKYHKNQWRELRTTTCSHACHFQQMLAKNLTEITNNGKRKRLSSTILNAMNVETMIS